MNIEDIGLGDIVRFGKEESIVIAKYVHTDLTKVLVKAHGWTLEQVFIDTWNRYPDRYSLIPNLSDFLGLLVCWIFPTNIDCVIKKANIQTSSSSAVAPTAVQERPCTHCGRKNDIGVKECWHCLHPNP